MSQTGKIHKVDPEAIKGQHDGEPTTNKRRGDMAGVNTGRDSQDTQPTLYPCDDGQTVIDIRSVFDKS